MNGYKYVFYCPKCKQVFLQEDKSQTVKCGCGRLAFYKGQYKWEDLSDTEKDSLMRTWDTQSSTQPSSTQSYGSYSPSRSSGWIKGLKVVAYIVGIACVIAFTVIGSGLRSGFLGFLLGVIVGFLTIASSMVFLDMAQDIREIRNKMR